MCDDLNKNSIETSTSTNQTKIVNKLLIKVKKQLPIYSSTPNNSSCIGMDNLFPKLCEQTSQSYLQGVDNDSGYISHNQESNTGNMQESNYSSSVVTESVYISEDALLEQPGDAVTNDNTNTVYQEFSHLYYLNSIVDESVSPVKSTFSGLQDSSSSIPEISPVLSIQKNIAVNSNTLNLPYFNVPENVHFVESYSTNTTDIKYIPQDLNQCYNVNTNGTNYFTIEPAQNSCDYVNTQQNVNIANNIIPNLETSSLDKYQIGENIENDMNVCNRVKEKKSTPKKLCPRKRKRSLSRTPQKRPKVLTPDRSPDLFSDDDTQNEALNAAKSEKIALSEQYLHECDRKLVKNVSKTLSGVPPPHCLTTIHMSVDEMLQKIKSNKEFYCDEQKKGSSSSSLLVNTTIDNCLTDTFPDILHDRFHGLYHNRSKVSEEFESLCMKYLQRYVSTETQSSCTVFDSNQSSPSKRRSTKLRWTAKSPGRRLSHLARRRITFSSANLQGGTSSGISNSRSRQIMVEAKRYEMLTRKQSPRKGRTPKKTPRKSPRKSIKTPTSSMKKKMAFKVRSTIGDEAEAGPSTSSSRASTTKRALFQSPDDKIVSNKVSKIVFPSTSNSSVSPWKKRATPKRALFVSPVKNSPSKNKQDGNKRKRSDSEDVPPCKIPRSLSMQLEPSSNASKLYRVRSDSCIGQPAAELSAHHKKKLQWAVYEALRGQGVTLSHPQFRTFACILARVTRRLLPPVPAGPKEVGTSERMLRIAKQHVFAVCKGKKMEEIILTYEASKAKANKPIGYISKEDLAKMDVSVARKDNVFQDKANTLNSLDKTINDPMKKTKPENKIERVRKIINFDEDSGLSGFR